MMMFAKKIGVPALHLIVICLATGCLTTRQGYYGSVHRQRAARYEAWTRRSHGGDRPTIHGALALEEAVRLALQYNPALQAALRQREQAEGRRLEAYSEVLPRLDAGASYARLDQVTTVDLGVETFQIGDLDNYSYRVEVTQPLFKGSAPMAIRGARLFSYLADEQVRGAVETVVSNVALAYYDAILAQRLIAVHSDTLRAAEAHLENVESRSASGMATEYDVLRAKVDVSNTKADLIEQKNSLNIAKARLLKAMGVSQQGDAELTTDLAYERVHATFAEAVQTAFYSRPDIYQAILNVDLQQEAVKEIYARYLPTVDAYYWHLWAKPDPHESSNINWGTKWQAGLGLNWTLFDGLAREGQLVQGKALLRQREIELTDTEEWALLEIRTALDELHNARELVQSQELNLERAEQALQLVQVGYREGVNTEVEVLDARAALTRATGLHYTALHRHTTSRINLQRAMGLLTTRPGDRHVPGNVKDVGHIRGPAEPGGAEPGQVDLSNPNDDGVTP